MTREITDVKALYPQLSARDEYAEDRDRRALAFDHASEIQDDRAAARDERADLREEAADDRDPAAASDRTGASIDRQLSAANRDNAADDRENAAKDRVTAARDRETSSIDGLTGAHRRDAGILELEREVARAKRTGQSLLIAFVDVDGLKTTNDSKGHAAGDELLRQTVACLRNHLRSYDLIVRYGGDEFVCCLVELSPAAASLRFDAVNADLAMTFDGSITVGVAELGPDDSPQKVIGRADEALYQKRALRSSA